MNHPLLSSLTAIDAVLDEVAEVDPIYLSTAEKKAVMVLAAKVRARLDAMQMSVVAASDDVAVATGARSTATWLAHETRDNPGQLRRAAHLGKALDRRWHRVAQELAAGRITTAQAHVITHALDALPDVIDQEQTAKAEAYLVEKAAEFGPRELTRLGMRILEVIAPEIAEEADYQRLLAEDRRSRQATRLTFRRRGDGTTEGYFRLPDPVANRLRVYLDGFTSPRNKRLAQKFGEVDSLPLAQRRGLAFIALLENMPANGLPQQGGVATTISVKIDHDKLLADLEKAGIAVTSTGDRIPAGEARRLACRAGLLPHVLSGKSVVLDQGRKKRLHDDNQRSVIHLIYDSCAETDCEIPVAWTEIHHPKPWSEGGTTDLSGVPLCPLHHHRAHDPKWEAQYHPAGHVTFTRRQ